MFIAFCIVFVLAAIGASFWLFSTPVRDKTGRDPLPVREFGKVATLITGTIAGILLVFASLAYVPANQVGVVTNFGTWGGTASSGISFVAPWSTVDTFPTRNQKSIRDQGEGNEPCVSVKLKGNASACVDLTVLYTIDEKNAEILWRGWGSFEKLNSDLINRSTDDAVNEVMSGYAAEELPTSRAQITEKITTGLRNRLLPQGVSLESVTLGDTHLPQDVQDRINSILQQDARTKVAEGQKAQAIAEAEAARERQASLTREALIRECIEAAREIKPQFFDCGLGGSGQQPSLIIGNR